VTTPEVVRIVQPSGGVYALRVRGNAVETYTLVVTTYMRDNVVCRKAVTNDAVPGAAYDYVLALGNVVGPVVDVRRLPWAAPQADFDPDTLNLKSNGRTVTCHIEIPRDRSAGEIDVETVRIARIAEEAVGPLYAVQFGGGKSPKGVVGDADEDGIADLTVKFDRGELQSCVVYNTEALPIEVAFELEDETLLTAVGTVRVIHGIDPPPEGVVSSETTNQPEDQPQEDGPPVVSVAERVLGLQGGTAGVAGNLVRLSAGNRALLAYRVTERCAVAVTVYDVHGSLVATLVRETRRDPGVYVLEWPSEGTVDGEPNPGLYIVSLRVGETTQTRRVVVLR
jgi:hypothetical protein